MPAWVISVVIPLLIKYGPAFALVMAKLLLRKRPELLAIVEQLLGGLKDPNTPNPVARQQALSAFKSCQGVACPTDLKKSE